MGITERNPTSVSRISVASLVHCNSLLAAAPLLLLLLLAGGVGEARADAWVSGTVFCDQCKDGKVTLFDYPLAGATVAVACEGDDGQAAVVKELKTSWVGSYGIKFDGAPDLSRCTAQVVAGSGAGPSSGCAAAVGPAQGLKLMFRIFDTEFYTVDALISQPAVGATICPKPPGCPPPDPAVLPPPPPPALPRQSPSPPSSPVLPPPALPRQSPSPPTAVVLPPPLPLAPPQQGPSPPAHIPFLGASTCPYQKWSTPAYRCYWKVVVPDTKVAVAFGIIAASKYGNDMTLWQALHGRGNVYATLLREATTALLNSYNSIRFPYPMPSIIVHMNMALAGSPQQALRTAMRFRRANAGGGNLNCDFTPCK